MQLTKRELIEQIESAFADTDRFNCHMQVGLTHSLDDQDTPQAAPNGTATLVIEVNGGAADHEVGRFEMASR